MRAHLAVKTFVLAHLRSSKARFSVSDQEAPPSAMRPESLDPFHAKWFQVEAAVLRYLRVRLKCRDKALDALHDVYEKVRKRSGNATILHMESYALAVARNIVAGGSRVRSRHSRLNEDIQNHESASRGDADERTPERIYDEQDYLERAAQAFKQLPTETQRICEAIAKGETIKAIAERLDLKVHTVYRRLRSARQWLREKLGLARGRKP